MPIRVTRHGPIITANMLPGSAGENINGPSLIKVPDWLKNPLGRYYLYFAHHIGKYIRLAYTNDVRGPWKIYEPGSLPLESCPAIKQHIASPDVHIDDDRRQFVMFFHGPSASTRGQTTHVALSSNGIEFFPQGEIIGPSYARWFTRKGFHYLITGAAPTPTDSFGRRP